FTTKDKDTLAPGVWLNDVVVTLFFSLLQNTVTSQQKVFFLNSYFMTKMFDDWNNYDYKLVQRWFKELDLSNANTIYVPINITKTHWILGIIHPQKKLIEICDSLTRKYNKKLSIKRAKVYGHVLLLFMEDRAKSRSLGFDITAWSIVQKECPQQINDNDCGVFVSIYALFHSQNVDIQYNQKYIDSRRPEILQSILT
ncbi:cysteine proteinase, partial [Fragilariopsis cylindrus CCMP1102]